MGFNSKPKIFSAYQIIGKFFFFPYVDCYSTLFIPTQYLMLAECLVAPQVPAPHHFISSIQWPMSVTRSVLYHLLEPILINSLFNSWVEYGTDVWASETWFSFSFTYTTANLINTVYNIDWFACVSSVWLQNLNKGYFLWQTKGEVYTNYLCSSYDKSIGHSGNG